MINRKHNSGFTLVEILIAMGIFMMAVLLISGIYVAFSKSQARAKAAQTLLNNSQYTLEIMAREIKNSEIFDYNPNNSGGSCGLVSCCDYYIGSDYESCILLKKESGQLFAFVADLGTENKLYYVVPPGTSYVADPWEDDAQASTQLLGPVLNDVSLDSLDFVLSPSTDPFSNSGPNVQPKITISMATTYYSDQEISQVSYNLQTTVSSRIYKR